MPPSGLLLGREDDIGYEKLVLRTYAEKAKPLVIAVPMSLISDHWTPCCSVIPHSSIEVTKDDQFVPWCNGRDEFIQLSVELILHRFIIVKGWNVE